MKLDNLKKICIVKKTEANNLYASLCNNILKRDINILVENYPDFENPKPDIYKTSKIEYRINKDILEIIDDRRESFLWCFEILIDGNLRLGSAFTFNKKIYDVSIISNSDNDLITEIEKVITEYDNTIQYLKDNNDFTKYTYKYECDHEEIQCLNIQEVYNTVMNRKI